MVITRETWVHAQCAVLGACLIEPKCAGEIVFGLRDSDFAEEYRTLYRAIRELYTTGKPVDPVTVLNAVGAEYRNTILQLMEITPTAANIGEYIAITANQSRVLHMREVGMRLLEVDDLSEAQKIMDGANGMMVRGGMASSSMMDLLTDFFSRYISPPTYLEWFIPQLRRVIRLKAGNYMIIGARPSVGKSAIAMQAAVFWAVVAGKRTAFYSAEMSEADITDRLVACCAGIPLEDIQERRLDKKQLDAASELAIRIREAPLYVIPAAGHTVADIRSHALEHHMEIVIIDYLQIISGPGEKEYDRVTRVSHEIQMLCKSTGVTVLALSQLDRLKGAAPTLEDLRSSGQLEQDADIVAFLHRKGDQANAVEFIVAKNRNGKTGTTKLEFDGSRQRFLYVGKGDKALKPFDYLAKTYQPQSDELEQLSMDEPVPFDERKD